MSETVGVAGQITSDPVRGVALDHTPATIHPPPGRPPTRACVVPKVGTASGTVHAASLGPRSGRETLRRLPRVRPAKAADGREAL